MNDAPDITGQMPVATMFNTSRTLMFSDLQVTDVDNTYPTGFTLTASDGTNYTRSGNQITPALNFFGTLSIPVKVNDGGLDSNTFSSGHDGQPAPRRSEERREDRGASRGRLQISFIGNPGQQYTVQFNAGAYRANWQFHSFQIADAKASTSSSTIRRRERQRASTARSFRNWRATLPVVAKTVSAGNSQMGQ